MENQERRRYFRIDDECILSFSKLTQREKAEGINQLNSGDGVLSDNAGFSSALESDLIDLITQLNTINPEFAQAIEILNRKINLLANGAPLVETPKAIFDHSPEMINLSASGLACQRNEPVTVGSDLKLELVLLPANTYMSIFGHVISCESIENGEYRIAIEFDNIRDEDFDRLILHIMRKESDVLKDARQQGKML